MKKFQAKIQAVLFYLALAILVIAAVLMTNLETVQSPTAAAPETTASEIVPAITFPLDQSVEMAPRRR